MRFSVSADVGGIVFDSNRRVVMPGQVLVPSQTLSRQSLQQTSTTILL